MPLSLMLFLRANRRYIAELVLASVLVNALVLSLPVFSMLVYDKAMGNQVHDTLWAMTIGMALLLGLELMLRMVRVVAVEHAGARWDARLDERLMRGVLAAEVGQDASAAEAMARADRQLLRLARVDGAWFDSTFAEHYTSLREAGTIF